MIKFRYKRKEIIDSNDDSTAKSTPSATKTLQKTTCTSTEAKKSAIISGLRKNGISAVTKPGNTLTKNSGSLKIDSEPRKTNSLQRNIGRSTPVENGKVLPKTALRVGVHKTATTSVQNLKSETLKNKDLVPTLEKIQPLEDVAVRKNNTLPRVKSDRSSSEKSLPAALGTGKSQTSKSYEVSYPRINRHVCDIIFYDRLDNQAYFMFIYSHDVMGWRRSLFTQVS